MVHRTSALSDSDSIRNRPAVDFNKQFLNRHATAAAVITMSWRYHGVAEYAVHDRKYDIHEGTSASL